MSKNTNRELVELAAKAVGITGEWVDDSLLDDFYKLPQTGIMVKYGSSTHIWNSTTSTGDALRLATDLLISIEHQALIQVDEFTHEGITEGEYAYGVEVWRVDSMYEVKCQELYDNDPYNAVRLAITKAAAEIARTME